MASKDPDFLPQLLGSVCEFNVSGGGHGLVLKRYGSRGITRKP